MGIMCIRIIFLLAAYCLLPLSVDAMVRHYKFNVVMKNATRLCSTKPIVTINGNFPGPTIYAREDDTVLVKVVNHVKYNVSIHWHGIRQLRTGWADGPAYITQCPIQPGQVYMYNFTLTGQRGTLWWHAHILWLRATVHGAIVILPKLGVPYPFPRPHMEQVIILSEWWKSDTEAIINEALKSGLAPNVSDAHTINGHPGPVQHCASQEGFKFQVEPGKTYLLRIINAALNEDLFFKIAGHKFTVVEVDAAYTKPFKTDTIVITPGQTTNVLLKTNHASGKYMVAASTFMDAPIAIDNVTATATLHYPNTLGSTITTLTSLPPINSTKIANSFTDSLKSLNSHKYPARVPKKIDHSLFFTVSLGVNPCATCPNGSRVVAAINNVTFVMPKISLLQAHFFNISGIFTDDFPRKPEIVYDFTGNKQPSNFRTNKGTRVYRLAYNSTVQLILQDTGMIAPENHPIHLHGFNFFVVGKGQGNFNPKKDTKKFNLVDPVERNTVGVPSGGWTAIRFRADNPGVWFMHCHLEIHTTWGLKMAFVVDNGKGPNESLLPPPSDLPKC
ncbi:putative laccase [Medicago truncatula]|uniref:Laccase n=1 Tax=Medicago truncatula TaxID=3880 RepID=G7KE42_MEDTR|nr:laccase-4 [Medicago truncatula]AES98533.2 laccase/diphenol oxidase family protein [Medicago truncatula]RHN56438.1 putative laccase [Medicago truncatula]